MEAEMLKSDQKRYIWDLLEAEAMISYHATIYLIKVGSFSYIDLVDNDGPARQSYSISVAYRKVNILSLWKLTQYLFYSWLAKLIQLWSKNWTPPHCIASTAQLIRNNKSGNNIGSRSCRTLRKIRPNKNCWRCY